jgi:hypothetical protein
MIKYVYEIDYPLGQKRSYLEWVRTIADTLQAPDELRRLVSYDNVFSASPHRVIEFTFDSMKDAGRYFERPEVSRILQGELPGRGSNIQIKVLKLLGDYSKNVVDEATSGPGPMTASSAVPLEPGEPPSAQFEPDASQ